MKLEEKLLTVNEHSRSGDKLKGVKAVVLHWTGAPQQRAKNTWQFFENRKLGKDGDGGAHFIVDLDGSIIQCIPEDEMAYHVGSSTLDPVSKKMYTDKSRALFGTKADGNGCWPNPWCLGIEMCVLDAKGNFSPETLQATKELCVSLLKKYKLGIDALTTHYEVVGWKDCPRLWYNDRSLFDKFKEEVKAMMA